MKVMHDFECSKCGLVFERFVHSVTSNCECDCGSIAYKTFENWGSRGQLPTFPEGEWQGLPEVDGHAPDIRTKRQLREALKKKAKDEFTESYSAYDDGYGGY
jgi:predicted  nucleic acid-binding Zn-ribbon protein